MFVLDLFNTKFERELNEGGVDNLEARRIDTLNDRMQELLARAREDNYKNNPAALAALKKQFQQVKDERDSYYKVREAGIPGNVPVEKIPGKEDLLKGKGRSYYEGHPVTEISDQTVQNYKEKAWDQFAQGKDRRGAGIGRALDKQRGAFGHVKTTDQKKNSEAVDEGQVSDEVTHRGDVDTKANIEVLGVDLANDTFKITYNGKPYQVKIQLFSQEDLGRWQIADYDVDIINSKGKNIIDLVDWDNDRQVTMVNTIIAYLDTQQAGDIQLMAWRQVGIENSTAEELYQEIQDFYQNDQQKIDKATAWLAQNIEDTDQRQVFADFVKNTGSRPARTKYIPKEYLMYVAFSYSREGNTELTPGMNLKPIQLDDPDDEEELYRKVDELFRKVQFKFDAFENKIVELADSYGLGSDPDLGSGFGQREMIWDHKTMTTSSSESNKNRQQILAKAILNFQAEVKKYVESFNNTLIKIGLPGIGEYSTWSGVLGDQLTDQQVRYFDTPEGFANLASGKVDLAQMLDDNVEKLGLKETGNPTLGEKKLGQLRPKLGTGRDIGRSVRKFRAQRGLDEQHNPKDDDWYDDEDEDLRLRSGDYVRDQMDGESGEIFRMQGDPYERRVRILDRDGKGWYIEPSRLTRVDPQDPDVQRYFGKQRRRDMDEMDKSQPSQERHGDRPLGAKGTTATPVAAKKVVKDLAMNLDQAFAKQKPVKNKGVAEGKADYNFDAEDLKRLERIRDLPTLKTQALALISRPSAKPMKPEKVEWFKNALDRMNSPIKVIKLMYDLLLSGEGHAVVGSKSSMNPNSYRQRFGEQGVSEARPITSASDTTAGAKKLWQYIGRNLEDLASNADFDAERNELYINDRLNNLFKTVDGQPVRVAFDMGSDIALDKGILYIPIGTIWQYRGMYTAEKFITDVVKALSGRAVEEGWSDAMVSRRTGQPRTPYSVYIKGKKWKDFENDDLARAVMNKLKAKFRADGRDPETVTIAPTDMSEGVGEEQLNEFLPVLAAVGGALARGVVGAGAAVGSRGIASAGVRSKLASELDDEETNEEKTRLDPKCWTGKKIGNPKTKVKGGVRVNNCVPAESINEEQDSSGVERAILNRIMVAHTDLLMKFGPDKVMQAAEEVAYNVGDVDEIGTSDVSAYVAQVKQILGAV